MPGRPSSARSDGSDADDGLAEREQEFQKLERQYRRMKCDKDAYTIGAQDTLRIQQKEIAQLEAEKNETLKELRLAESRSNQARDERECNKLVELSDDKTNYQEEIENEKLEQINLDAEIRKWERKIKEQHKNMGGVHMSHHHTVKTQKKVRVLENRLDRSSKEFNATLAENSAHRDEITSLRIERKRFENLYQKLDKELTQLRREIGEVIESSTQAYDARDEAQAKMILLKEKSDKDTQQHNADMKELIRIIEHDRKLKEFMNIKGQEREEDPELTRYKQKKAEEMEKKREQQEERVESYAQAFKRMQEITGEETLQLTIEKFIKKEDDNFALFNYVSEQNNRCERLQDEMNDINEDIARFKRQGVEMENRRKEIMKELEVRNEHASKDADESEERLTEVKKILDQLRAGVESLFGKINCDRRAIDDLLGSHHGVTDQNMLQYMGIIEQRTNELLSVEAYEESKEYEKYDKKPPRLLGEGPQAHQAAPYIIAPAVGDEYETENSDQSDEERPFTRGELRKKVEKTVRKRESAARKDGFKYDLSDARAKQKKKKDDK